jgi:hypothetical protein
VSGVEPVIRITDPDRLIVTGSTGDDGDVSASIHELFRTGLGPDFDELTIDVLSPDLSRLLST